MLYLIFAILCSTMVSLVMRISEKYTDKQRNFAMLAVNYLTCVVLAVAHTGTGRLFLREEGTQASVALGAVTGFLYLMGFVLLQINTKRNGVVMSATFMRLGVLIPTVLSVVIFGEQPTALQVIGFLIALAAIIGISTEDQSEKSVIGFKAGLILLLVTGGMSDMMSKIYDEVGNPELSDQFLLCTFLFAFGFCVVFLLTRRQGIGRMEVLFGVLLAFPNYYSARFLLRAVTSVPAVVAYPTYSVGAIVMISAAGILFFHERISRRQKIAIAGILAALVLLNI